LIAGKAQLAKGIEEGRNQNDPAPDPQQASDHPGKGTDGQKNGKHRQEFNEIGHGSGSGLGTLRHLAAGRGRGQSGKRLTLPFHPE